MSGISTRSNDARGGLRFRPDGPPAELPPAARFAFNRIAWGRLEVRMAIRAVVTAGIDAAGVEAIAAATHYRPGTVRGMRSGYVNRVACWRLARVLGADWLTAVIAAAETAGPRAYLP